MFVRRAQGTSQKELIDQLFREGTIKVPEVREVLSRVDRKNYIDDQLSEDSAYYDSPLPIGRTGQTISAPHMHAHALEEMFPYLKKSTTANLSILDVGCGSGYLTAALGRAVDEREPLFGKPGKVYAIDVYPTLVETTTKNMKKQDSDLLTHKVVEIAQKNGWDGWPEKAPFDAIHVGAAADAFPQNLMMQLKVGGVLLVPVEASTSIEGIPGQIFYKIERLAESAGYEDKDFRKEKFLSVRYVPLVH